MSQAMHYPSRPVDGITDADFQAIEALVAAWQAPWFIAHREGSPNRRGPGDESSWVSLEQIGGPPFGNGFSIGFNGEGYSVTYSVSADEDPDEWALCETVEEAVQQIEGFVIASLVEWGVTIAA